MRIALICNEYPPAPHGGIGSFIYTYAHGLLSAGHEVVVVGLDEDSKQFSDRGVRIVMLPKCEVRGLAWFISRYRLYSWLRRQVEDRRIDVIEIPDFQGPLPLPFPYCPVVVRLHNTATALSGCAIPASVGTKLCELLTLCFHRNWIGVSNFVLQITRRTFHISPKNSRVIFCPVHEDDDDIDNDSRALDRNWGDQYVLFGGRVSRSKGALVLAQAAGKLLDESAGLGLVYAGPVVSENGIRCDEEILRVIPEKFHDRVHFLGRVSNPQMRAVMRKALCFVLPSALESFGLVVAEAMLQACPVIVPAGPPFTEYIINGENGFLVPLNDPIALRDTILRVVNNFEDAKAIGLRGRATAIASFSLKRTIAASEEFYSSLLTKKRAT